MKIISFHLFPQALSFPLDLCDLCAAHALKCLKNKFPSPGLSLGSAHIAAFAAVSWFA